MKSIAVLFFNLIFINSVLSQDSRYIFILHHVAGNVDKNFSSMTFYCGIKPNKSFIREQNKGFGLKTNPVGTYDFFHISEKDFDLIEKCIAGFPLGKQPEYQYKYGTFSISFFRKKRLVKTIFVSNTSSSSQLFADLAKISRQFETEEKGYIFSLFEDIALTLDDK
jgi:hypothetical protein